MFVLSTSLFCILELFSIFLHTSTEVTNVLVGRGAGGNETSANLASKKLDKFCGVKRNFSTVLAFKKWDTVLYLVYFIYGQQ